MTEKIYARVSDQGDILDYPVYEYVIKARGHTVDMYVPVDNSNKPVYDEYQDVNETLSYNRATNVVTVNYEVKDKDIDYLFSKLNSKVFDPEFPGDESKAKQYVPTEQDRAKLQQLVVKKVEQELDGLAQAKQYDSIVSLVGYVNSTDAHFKAEAIYGDNIRSTTYRNLYTFLGKVLAGEAQLPTSWNEVKQNANLPDFNWDAYVAPKV